MIKRETIKQAIDAISQRNAEIGYTLDEMLGRGIIDAPSPEGETLLGDDFFFFFDDYKARVSKFLYINKGTVPIEERLLVKYGELLKKRELMERGEPVDDPAAAKTIRIAGLRFMVLHEIDSAIERINKSDGIPAESLVPFLETVKQQTDPLTVSPDGNDHRVLYSSVVGVSTRALFLPFPFCMDSLLQVAHINLEFFHVRFFLNRLIQGQIQNNFVCVVDNRIIGAIYLIFKQELFFRNLVIDFVATLRGKMGDPSAASAPRGIGAFLVAGVWLEWKTGAFKARDITLDSEVGARGFYDSLGFQPRGFAEFVLKAPKGHLLKSIITMRSHRRLLPPSLVREIGALMEKQVKSLGKRPKTEKDAAIRKRTIEAVREFLTTDTYAGYSERTVRLLLKYKERIPESESLLRDARCYES